MHYTDKHEITCDLKLIGEFENLSFPTPSKEIIKLLLTLAKCCQHT